MGLLSRRKAQKKWHKKAIFVDLSNVKIVFEKTERPRKPEKPKRLPSWLINNDSVESSFSSRSPHITSHNVELSCIRLPKNSCNNQNCDMPLFMVKKKYFDLYRFGKKDVELRTVKPQWKNSKIGDIATIQCGKEMIRKRITKILRGTLTRIFLNVDYKRMFPEASTMFEAVKATKELYPDSEEFMAFELEEII